MIPLGDAVRRTAGASGTCPGASEIGTATVSAGAGPEPYPVQRPRLPHRALRRRALRPVDTDRGGRGHSTSDRVVTQAAIGVDPDTARGDRAERLPTIVGGVPLRLRDDQRRGEPRELPCEPDELRAARHRTRCSGSTLGASDATSSAFPGERRAAALAFTPSLHAESNRLKASKANGASLEVTRSHRLPTRRTSARSSPAAGAAPLAPDDAAESVRGRNVRRQPAQLPGAIARRQRHREDPGAARQLSAEPAYLVSHGGAALSRSRRRCSKVAACASCSSATPTFKSGVTTSTFAHDPRCARVELPADAADGHPTRRSAAYGNLCAEALIDADDDHRSKRSAVQTEHAPIGVGLQRKREGTTWRAHRALADRPTTRCC